MNLKLYLLGRIIIVAFICLLATSSYVLYRADQQSKLQSQKMLDSISKQLEFQLLRIDAGFGQPDKFPDLSLWKETQSVPGVCIRYSSVKTPVNYSICRGSEWIENRWTPLFAKLYLFIFNPALELQKKLFYKGRIYGLISITPGIDSELSRAWESIYALLELSTITILAVCLAVYLAISRALRPAQLIVSGLEEMQQGDLSVRLPHFELSEWQRTSSAINALAISQQQLLSERKKLTFKLISMQDKERRYLARELHDELGQCLATINAHAAIMTQTARQECPQLVEEAESISRINRQIMDTVHNLLARLRPSEIDSLGLELSLRNLFIEWNTRSKNIPYYQLKIIGDCQDLLDPYPITLFRIIQECLTNIAKYSSATNATATLNISDQLIELTIDDNGNIDTLPFADHSGFGLLGIRERVDALGGKLNMAKNKSGGLSIKACFPMNLKVATL